MALRCWRRSSRAWFSTRPYRLSYPASAYDPSLQSGTSPTSGVTIPPPGTGPTASGPTLGTTIEGTNFDTNGTNNGGWVYIPPDPNGAVGPNQIVSMVNCTIQWEDKSGGSQVNKALGAQGNGTAIAGSLFNSLAPKNGLFDPVVIYDQYASRFVVEAGELVDSAHTSRELLAVSKDSNPNDGWWLESVNTTFTSSFNGGPTLSRWLDYPHMSVDDKAIYLTGNLFAFSSDGGSFGGERTLIIPKGAGTGGLYDGGSSTSNAYDPFALSGTDGYQQTLGGRWFPHETAAILARRSAGSRAPSFSSIERPEP